MSLGTKIFATLLVFITVYAVFSGLILFWGVLPHFYELEREEAAQDLHRLTSQVSREVKALDSLCLDWSAWDDTLEYVTKNDPALRAEYEKENLELLWYKQLRFNLLYILDAQGNVVWGRAYDDPAASEPKVVTPPEFSADKWPASHPLTSSTEPVSGIMETSLGLVLISSRPITDSQMKSPSQGRMIMGRLLDHALVSSICERSHVAGHLTSVSSAHIPGGLKLDSPIRYEPESALLRAFKLVPGISGEPAVLAQVEKARTVTHRGQVAVYYALLSTMLTAVLAFVVVMVLLRWVVVNPVLKLTGHVTSVTSHDTLRLLQEPRRNDELAVLTREFNRMVQRIQEDRARREQVEVALRESETEVLRGQHLALLGQMGASMAHEIRNPLTAISSAVQVIREEFGKDDERREIMTEILDQVERVNGIARRLLMYVRTWVPNKQPEDLCQIVRRVCFQAKQRSALRGIELILEEHDKLEAEVDAGLLEQVAWNLMQNSADAMESAESEVREIRWSFENDGDVVRLSVCDTGPGLSEEIQIKAFKPFFTTKRHGTGLGLVVCKNIVEAHGGRISLESRLGRGTKVVIELPRGTYQ